MHGVYVDNECYKCVTVFVKVVGKMYVRTKGVRRVKAIWIREHKLMMYVMTFFQLSSAVVPKSRNIGELERAKRLYTV